MSEPKSKVFLFRHDRQAQADFVDYYAAIQDGYVLDPRLHGDNRLWVMKFGEDNYLHVAFMIKAQEEDLAEIRAEIEGSGKPAEKGMLERGIDFVEITPPEEPGVIPKKFGKGWKFFKATKGALALVKIEEDKDE